MQLLQELLLVWVSLSVLGSVGLMELGRDSHEVKTEQKFLVPHTAYIYATTLHGSKLQVNELVYGMIY